MQIWRTLDPRSPTLYSSATMRRVLYWYLPLLVAVIAATAFAGGFLAYLRGDTGIPVNVVTRPSEESAPRDKIMPIILGDSLARGTGDESGLGIGGRLVDELRRRKINTANLVNVAINGARTADLLQQLESPNIRRLLSESNVIILSIGGNDLWGDGNFRNAPPKDPDAVMDQVLENVEKSEKVLRAASPNGRIFIIGLYNPFVTTPMGVMLTPFVNRWNAKLIERFASDPKVVIVQTSDLFAYRDRLSLDRFHPGDEGYAMIARRIADAL